MRCSLFDASIQVNHSKFVVSSESIKLAKERNNTSIYRRIMDIKNLISWLEFFILSPKWRDTVRDYYQSKLSQNSPVYHSFDPNELEREPKSNSR